MEVFYDVNLTAIEYVLNNPDLRNLILKHRKFLMLQYLKKKICNVIKNDMFYRCVRGAGPYFMVEQSIRIFKNNPDREICWCNGEGNPLFEVWEWNPHTSQMENLTEAEERDD